MSNCLIVKPEDIVSAGATDSDTGYTPLNVANDYMGVVWRSQAGTSKTMTIDLGEDREIDTILFLGCDGATSSFTIRVDASTDALGSTYPVGAYIGATVAFLGSGEEAPESGRPIAIWRAPVAIPASRYWRFIVGGLGGGKLTIGRVVIGKALGLERNFSFPAQLGVRDFGGVEFSRRAAMLRRRGAKLRTLSLTLNSVRKDEIEEQVQPLLQAIGNTETLAIVTDPDAHAQRQRRVFFGPLVGDLLTVWRTSDGWTAGLNMVSLV